MNKDIKNNNSKEIKEHKYFNNIYLFLITIILSIIQIINYNPKLVNYSLCDDNECVCGFSGIRFEYTPGIIHNVLMIIFILIFIGIIILSIYIAIRTIKKKISKGIINIVFAIIIIFCIYKVPITSFIDDIKYGNEIQETDEVLKDYGGPNSYIRENCNRGGNNG